MTIAGMNIAIDIWRETTQTDDYVGGASISGSVVYQSIPARMQGARPQQLLLQQGLETDKVFRVTLIPGTLDIRERDEIQVVKPDDHPYINSKFRVLGVRYSDFNSRDPRNFMILEVSRSVRSHDQQ